MFKVGQEVMVISEKGIAYDGYILARATGDDGLKAYKIAIDGGGMEQMGQWHKASDVFVMDPRDEPEGEESATIERFGMR